MNHRTQRLFGAVALTSTLFGAALAGSVIAKAAPLTVTATNLSPAVVSQGQLGAFQFHVANTGTSNIAHLFLTEKSGASVYDQQNTRPGTCTTSGQLLCNFGALNAGDSIDLTFALIAPAASSWHVAFEFSSNGYVLGGNKSHGDLWTTEYSITTPTGDTADSGGTYVWDTAHTLVQNGQSIGNGNKQATTITLTDTNLPASVADGTSLTFTCNGDTSCPGTFFGQVSQVDVDNGADHLIHVTMLLYKPGKNPNQVNGVYHQWTTGTAPNLVLHEENITTVCGDPPTGTCYKATRVGSNNLQLDVYIPHNGKLGGF